MRFQGFLVRDDDSEMDSWKGETERKNCICESFLNAQPLNLPFESGGMELDITLDMCIRGWVTARRSDSERKERVGGGAEGGVGEDVADEMEALA